MFFPSEIRTAGYLSSLSSQRHRRKWPCTVDKATQHVTEITFANTDILKLEVKVVVATLNVKLALAVEENYSVAY